MGKIRSTFSAFLLFFVFLNFSRFRDSELVEDGASLATVVRASCPRRLEACTTNGRQIYASDY